MSKRPNFILFVTDQHRADHLGCYGNPIVRTPHIDSIAACGTRFERFYVSSPVCMANRATMLTGRMPSLHGVRHNGIPLVRDSTTFVDLLKSAGYRTALIGKSHLQNFGVDGDFRRRWQYDENSFLPPEHLRDADQRSLIGRNYENESLSRWENDETHHVQVPFYGFDHVDLCTYHGDEVGGDYARWLSRNAPNASQLRGRANALRDDRYSAPQAWRTRLSTDLYPSTYIARQAGAWLQKHAAEHPDEPFFLMCSFPDPHHPYTPPGAYWDMYDPDTIPLPPSFFNRTTTDLIQAIHHDTQSGRTNRTGHTPFSVNEREAREIIALTYGMITLIDDCIGGIKASVRDLNLHQDTVMAFTSDHGDWMGDHGIMLKGPLHYQGLIRVPFIFSDIPGRASASVDHELAGTIDIARTILKRANINPNNGMQGYSLTSRRPDARAIVIESEAAWYKFGKDKNFRIRTLIDQRFRISISDDDEIGEIYDLAEDPHENHNLWGSVDHSELKMELLNKLAREMVRLTDTAPLPTALA